MPPHVQMYLRELLFIFGTARTLEINIIQLMTFNEVDTRIY